MYDYHFLLSPIQTQILWLLFSSAAGGPILTASTVHFSRDLEPLRLTHILGEAECSENVGVGEDPLYISAPLEIPKEIIFLEVIPRIFLISILCSELQFFIDVSVH